MTDEEIDALLIKLASAKVAQYQRRDPAYTPPDDLPEGIDSSIIELFWYVGAKPSRAELIAHGLSEQQADAALARKKAQLGIIEPEDLIPIPPDLAAQIDADLRAALEEEPEGTPRRLDERVVQEITELRVEIYSNEGQHRGRPHVAVVLQDGKVSVSLDDPPVVLTPHGYRGEASAVKVVTKHRTLLIDKWNSTRPDDQKLPVKPKK